MNEGTHLVTEVNGKQTAQIMFFNGLSKTRANGEIDYLANPYIQDNLAFSLQMQVAANNKYPGFAQKDLSKRLSVQHAFHAKITAYRGRCTDQYRRRNEECYGSAGRSSAYSTYRIRLEILRFLGYTIKDCGYKRYAEEFDRREV